MRRLSHNYPATASRFSEPQPPLLVCSYHSETRQSAKYRLLGLPPAFRPKIWVVAVIVILGGSVTLPWAGRCFGRCIDRLPARGFGRCIVIVILRSVNPCLGSIPAAGARCGWRLAATRLAGLARQRIGRRNARLARLARRERRRVRIFAATALRYRGLLVLRYRG